MTRLFVPGVTRDDEEPQYVCTVPVGPSEICGRCWYDGEERAYMAHVGPCARRNMEHIAAQRLKERVPVFDEANWDKEIAEHMRKVGERMKAEGRLVVRKDERAGFS